MVPQFCPPCGDAQEVTRIDPNWRDRQILGDAITLACGHRYFLPYNNQPS